MFDLLKPTRTSTFAPLGPGTIASFGVHAAVFIALVVGRSTDPGVIGSWEQGVDRLTYIAPPDEVSSATQTQVRYEASGGTDGDMSAQREDPSGMPERGSGPGETARASLDGTELQATDPFENAFLVVEVEQEAERDPESAAPAYPPLLMQRGVEGYAAMRFVVDTTGRVDLMSVRILEATAPEFAVAVKDAMPGMKFTPARIGDRAVRQLAEQVFRFQIIPSGGNKVPTADRQPR